MINRHDLPNWKLWKKTFTKMDPSRKLVSDELIEDITDKIDKLDGFSTRIMMIAILENLTNDQLNSAAYWAFDLMSDRIDDDRMKLADVTVKDWLCHVSPSVRSLMLSELLRLEPQVDPLTHIPVVQDSLLPRDYYTENEKSQMYSHLQ